MARKSKWNREDRKKLLNMVSEGIAEQEIRDDLSIEGKAMSSAEFAQQLKMAMVEAGHIKQAAKDKSNKPAKLYEVTTTGRLNLPDFTQTTGFKAGDRFLLEKPRGRSKAWRLVPTD